MEAKAYKFLTYLLIVPNAFVALLAVISFFLALTGKILVLFQSLLLVSVVLFGIFSFLFMQKGIGSGKTFSYKFKRRIRLTAVMSLIFAITSLITLVPLVLKPGSLDMFFTTTFEMAKIEMPKGINVESVMSILKGFVYIWTGYFALLLLHILMTFKFVQLYKHLFELPPSQ
jgi:hypothetical protein